MTRNIASGTVMVLCLLAGCAQEPRIDAAAETEAIRAALDSYVKSVVDEDMQQYWQVMDRDSTMVNVGAGTGISWIAGWEELDEVMNGQNDAFSETTIDVPQEWIRVGPTGSFAWAVTRWDLATVLSDGSRALLPLRCSWVLEKRDGRWIIVHFHKSFGVESLASFIVAE
jgi:ketosteroid isomerase-like protein